MRKGQILGLCLVAALASLVTESDGWIIETHCSDGFRIGEVERVASGINRKLQFHTTVEERTSNPRLWTAEYSSGGIHRLQVTPQLSLTDTLSKMSVVLPGQASTQPTVVQIRDERQGLVCQLDYDPQTQKTKSPASKLSERQLKHMLDKGWKVEEKEARRQLVDEDTLRALKLGFVMIISLAVSWFFF